MKKKTLSPIRKGLYGIHNMLPHQIIISDFIYAIRKSYDRRKINNRLVLPKISASQLDFEISHSEDGLLKDYNFDLVICRMPCHTEMIIEIERIQPRKGTKEKLEDCLKKIDSLKEVLMVRYNYEIMDIEFIKCTLKNGKLDMQKTSSYSKYLNMNLLKSLKSLNIYYNR